MLGSFFRAVIESKRVLFNQNEVIVPFPYAEPYYGFTNGQEPPPSRRALLVYLPQALYQQQAELILHANVSTSRIVAETIAAQGYVIDALDWSDPEFELTATYDLVLCLSVANAQIIERVAKLAPTIYFATEEYLPFQRKAFNARVRRLYLRRHVHLTKRYPHERTANLPNAKAIIVKGIDRVAQPYKDLGVPIYQTDNFILPVQNPDLEHKLFDEAHRNFLWLGSSSLLHKGLDLVLEAFAAMPDLNLWICGPVESEAEREFSQIYEQELFHTPNIHVLGWTNVLDKPFTELANRCAFLIFPSCSEAQPGSVLNCMAMGIIPIVSKETNINIENFGVTLPDTEIETIRRVAREMTELSPERCRELAFAAYETATQRYTKEIFRAKLEEILEQLLPQN